MKHLILLTSFFIIQNTATASDWQLDLETGAVYQSRSVVKIPPDSGTHFSLTEAVGNGPLPYIRVQAHFQTGEKHQLRVLIAPLVIEDQGELNKEVNYNGKTFAAHTATNYRYQFNSYRFSYAYSFHRSPVSEWRAGFTAKIRQAEIALTQGNIHSSFTDLGFVPLLHLNGNHKLTPRWQLKMDLDASWSPYGRAADLGLFAHYSFDKNWSVGGGYRTVEGGADVDVVYNFAWLHYAGLQLRAAF